MRILKPRNLKEIQRLMLRVGVDPYGIGIMAPKALNYLIEIDSLACIEANILKQEMLSLGSDAAVSRQSLTGKAKDTRCLLMANLSQYRRLTQKLKRQPLGLGKLSLALSRCIDNYQKENFIIRCGSFKLNAAGNKTLVCAVINLTPDSFSGDGLLKNRKANRRIKNLTQIIDYAQELEAQGADILDVGGESTRPQARPVSLKEELSRVVPAVKLLVKKIKIPISIDTYKPEAARACLDLGASIINDITGLKDPRMARVIGRYKAAVIVMHSKGTPLTMQNNPSYEGLMNEILGHLDKRVKLALEAGISRESIIIDPGLGFGKTQEHNLEILGNLSQLKVLGLPIMVGASRKSFIGAVLKVTVDKRLAGTISASLTAVNNGACILRVHDVTPIKQAVRIINAAYN